MKNPVQPETELTIVDPMKGGEVMFSLRFDFESIARAEEITDRPLLMGLSRRDVNHPMISLVRAMLYAALLPTQPEITVEEAAAFVTKKSMAFIWGKLLIAWASAMQEPEDVKADPTKGQS